MAKITEVSPDYSPGEQIDLDCPEENYEGTYSTMLKRVEEEKIRMKVPRINGLYLPLTVGDELILKQYDQGATFEAGTTVVGRNDGGDTPMLSVRHPESVRKIQRRTFVRVPCDLPAEVLVLRSGSGKDISSLPDTMEGTIENISAGGVQVVLDHKLPKLTQIKLTFTIARLGKSMDDLFGQVLRVPESSTPPYELGISFSSITEKKRNVIIQYVYQRQRELKD